LALTKNAVDISPYNWLCWMFRTTTLSYANKGAEAYQAAKRTLSLPIPSIFRPFVESNCCLAACLSGDFDMATRFGEQAMAKNGKFQSTARSLLTVYANKGDYEQAWRTYNRIKLREQDFSIDLVSSDDYPIPSSDAKQLLISGLSKLDLH